MTPLEDRIRQALRGQAGDIPPGTAAARTAPALLFSRLRRR
jgi:hypothetical protein